jgi:hypothetical protein
VIATASAEAQLPRTLYFKRVGLRRPPLQLGLALAPALTRCLSRTQANALKTNSFQRASELSRISSRGLHSCLSTHAFAATVSISTTHFGFASRLTTTHVEAGV